MAYSRSTQCYCKTAARIISVLLFFLMVTPLAFSDEPYIESLVLQRGLSEENIHHYGIHINKNMEKRYYFDNGLTIRPKWVYSVGNLYRKKESSFMTSAGPGVSFYKEGLNLYLDLSFRLTYLTEPEIVDKDLGGNVHFSTYLSANYFFTQHFAAGLAAQHISNAGLATNNPGMNVWYLEFKYRF